MGGDCLNTGCVPSKALIRSAKLAHEGARAAEFGLTGRLEPDFAAVMARGARRLAKIAPHNSAERYRGLGVDVIAGRARVVDPWTVEVGGRRLTVGGSSSRPAPSRSCRRSLALPRSSR